MGRAGVALGGAVAAAAAVTMAPALTAIHPVRRVLAPWAVPDELWGVTETSQVALTYDDGPDPLTTPKFLDLLARHSTRATFFLLGEHAVSETGLLRRMVAEGHELGVHGWTHRCVAGIGPGRLARELARTKEVIEQATGREVAWYRPPYGVSTASSLRAARSARLTTVLWSAWGIDWRRGRTPEQIEATVLRSLRQGGTVLLHDTDRTSAPGSWRATLAASEQLLGRLAADGTPVGPLAEHGISPPRIPDW